LLRHTVFFKLKEPTEKNKEHVYDKIIGMKGRIEGLLDMNVGVNVSQDEKAYDIIASFDVENEIALQAFANDPVHVEVVHAILDSISDIKIVDHLVL